MIDLFHARALALKYMLLRIRVLPYNRTYIRAQLARINSLYIRVYSSLRRDFFSNDRAARDRSHPDYAKTIIFAHV